MYVSYAATAKSSYLLDVKKGQCVTIMFKHLTILDSPDVFYIHLIIL